MNGRVRNLQGLLLFALLTFTSQLFTTTLESQTGKIHGRVIGPEGAPRTAGSVSLSTDKGVSPLFTFQLSSNGDFAGEATPNTYSLIYYAPEKPAKIVDIIENVTIAAGQDLLQNIDMTRQAYIDKLSPDERQKVEELKKQILAKNLQLKSINVDMQSTMSDFRDAELASATARKELGEAATQSEIDARTQEIKTAKYTDAETLMLKDTALRPELSVLWGQLGQAQIGLKKYDLAEASFKKDIEAGSTAAKPSMVGQAQAYTGLGEAYIRNGKAKQALAAYDAAAKINPAQAAFNFKTESIIFTQVDNADGQVIAADEAIKADPALAIAYYLKGDGLMRKARKSSTAPTSDCREAYQKYLELAPNGTYADEVKKILASSM